jgi:hypothetical protein
MCWLGKWEELDDEEVVIHPACPTGEAKVFQPNAGICPTIVFYDVMRCLKALWETHITHVASKRLGPWPLGVEAVPLSVCTLSPPPPTVGLTIHQGLRVHVWMARRRRVRTWAGEDTVTTTWSSVVALCRLAFEWSRLEVVTAARR